MILSNRSRVDFVDRSGGVRRRSPVAVRRCPTEPIAPAAGLQRQSGVGMRTRGAVCGRSAALHVLGRFRPRPRGSIRCPVGFRSTEITFGVDASGEASWRTSERDRVSRASLESVRLWILIDRPELWGPRRSVFQRLAESADSLYTPSRGGGR